MKTLSRLTIGKPATIKSQQRRKAVAKNLVLGMTPEQALIEAGYNPTTARKKAYLVIRHSAVQSLLIECCELALQKDNKSFEDFLEPYVKALAANVVVKMSPAWMTAETTAKDN